MALITCQECGAQVSEFAASCPSCGNPVAKKTVTPSAQPVNSQNQQEAPPKTWLLESILVTILCCLPFGIAGIVNASKVESCWYSKDKEGALRASKEAAKWTKIGFFCGIAGYIIYGILILFGVMSGIYSASNYYGY